jgi:hypothetical protein
MAAACPTPPTTCREPLVSCMRSKCRLLRGERAESLRDPFPWGLEGLGCQLTERVKRCFSSEAGTRQRACCSPPVCLLTAAAASHRRSAGGLKCLIHARKLHAWCPMPWHLHIYSNQEKIIAKPSCTDPSGYSGVSEWTFASLLLCPFVLFRKPLLLMPDDGWHYGRGEPPPPVPGGDGHGASRRWGRLSATRRRRARVVQLV